MIKQIGEFQKESPYLHDFNFLIDMMNQMDLESSSNRINDYSKYVPNSTNCMTWQDVKASHESDTPEVTIKGDNIYGMVIILFTCLVLALVVLSLENFLPIPSARRSTVDKRLDHQVQDQNMKTKKSDKIAWDMVN